MSNIKEGFCHKSYTFWKKGPKWFKLQSLISQIVNLSRGREKCSLLMYASIPTTCLSSFFFSLFFYSFLSTSLPFRSSPFSLFTAIILFAMVRFTIFTPQLLLAPYRCPSRTAHWFAGCSTTTIALNVLVAPLSIPRQNCLSYFLPLFVFHFLHPDKD